MGDHEIPTYESAVSHLVALDAKAESRALKSLTSSSTSLLHFLEIASAKHKFGSGHDVTCLYQPVDATPWLLVICYIT